jgi:hypothetical protein
MNQFIVLAGVVVCAAIVVACICRVNLMRVGRQKLGWLALYILWAPFALGMLIDLVSYPWRVDWYVCFGVAGILLHLTLTRRKWAGGAPPETEIGQ